MLEVADDTDDAIDSVRDESVLDDELNNELDTDDVGVVFNTEIPVENLHKFHLHESLLKMSQNLCGQSWIWYAVSMLTQSMMRCSLTMQ